jgi:hypothetical protein
MRQLGECPCVSVRIRAAIVNAEGPVTSTPGNVRWHEEFLVEFYRNHSMRAFRVQEQRSFEMSHVTVHGNTACAGPAFYYPDKFFDNVCDPAETLLNIIWSGVHIHENILSPQIECDVEYAAPVHIAANPSVPSIQCLGELLKVLKGRAFKGTIRLNLQLICSLRHDLRWMILGVSDLTA